MTRALRSPLSKGRKRTLTSSAVRSATSAALLCCLLPLEALLGDAERGGQKVSVSYGRICGETAIVRIRPR
ncbi:MAG TPA: hypothetical protein VK421_07465 [Pyrinomonadaceae bacterium]|nr:hypothetical protein [Pyrinomonadaceae bacterium]